MMRRPLISLTTLLALTLPGYAQVNPNNLPANTVVGRLGTGTGPAQAIPLSVLQANLPPFSTHAAPPTITAGCTGAGSVIGTGSFDFDGNATGSTAAATTCTITFGTAYINTPSCVTSGDQSAILTQTRSTATLVVTFASTANFRFNWHCGGV